MTDLIPSNTRMNAVRRKCRSNPLFDGISLGLRGRSKAIIIKEMNDRIRNQWARVGSIHSVNPIHPNPELVTLHSFSLTITLITIVLLLLYITCNHNQTPSVQQSILMDQQRHTISSLEAQNEILNATQKVMVNRFEHCVADHTHVLRTLNQTEETLRKTHNELTKCKQPEARTLNHSQKIVVDPDKIVPLQQKMDSLPVNAEERYLILYLMFVAGAAIIAVLYWFLIHKTPPSGKMNGNGNGKMNGNGNGKVNGNGIHKTPPSEVDSADDGSSKTSNDEIVINDDTVNDSNTDKVVSNDDGFNDLRNNDLVNSDDDGGFNDVNNDEVKNDDNGFLDLNNNGVQSDEDGFDDVNNDEVNSDNDGGFSDPNKDEVNIDDDGGFNHLNEDRVNIDHDMSASVQQTECPQWTRLNPCPIEPPNYQLKNVWYLENGCFMIFSFVRQSLENNWHHSLYKYDMCSGTWTRLLSDLFEIIQRLKAGQIEFDWVKRRIFILTGQPFTTWPDASTYILDMDNQSLQHFR